MPPLWIWLLAALVLGTFVGVLLYVYLSVRLTAEDIRKLDANGLIAGALPGIVWAEQPPRTVTGDLVGLVWQGSDWWQVERRATPFGPLPPGQMILEGSAVLWQDHLVATVYDGTALALQAWAREGGAVTVLRTVKQDGRSGGQTATDGADLFWITADDGSATGSGQVWRWNAWGATPTVVSSDWWDPRGLAWDGTHLWVLDVPPTAAPQVRLFRDHEEALVTTATAGERPQNLTLYRGAAWASALQGQLVTLDVTQGRVLAWNYTDAEWTEVVEVPLTLRSFTTDGAGELVTFGASGVWQVAST